jgi:hypothetical protein
MNAAAIGLIGVIVGALLGGLVNLVVNRRTRRASARAAGRLIDVELEVAEQKIRSAVEAAKGTSTAIQEPPKSQAGDLTTTSQDHTQESDRPPEAIVEANGSPVVDETGWWIGDLPTEAWKEHQSELATDVSPDLMTLLAQAYALCADLNDQHAAAKASCAAPRGNLREYAHTLTTARSQLNQASILRIRKRRQRVIRWSAGLAIPALILALAIVALLTPRVDVNSASVTSALKSQLGHGMVVQCDPVSREWACKAYPPSWRTSCQTKSISSYQTSVAHHAVPISVLATSACTSTQQPVAFKADVHGKEVDAAVVEQSRHVKRVMDINAKLSTTNGLVRLWRSIVG